MNERDEFDDPKNGDFLGSVGPKAAFFIVLIALSFMLGVVWKLYVGGGSSGSGQNVPIIRAETEPYKVPPEEAGGMEMPHKDSTIFSSLNSDPDSDRRIENLLAESDDETPLPRSQLFAGLNTERSSDLHAEAQETPLDQPLTEDQERIVGQAKEAQKVVTNLVEDGAEAITSNEERVENVAEEVKEEKAVAVKEPQKLEPVVKETPKVEPKKVEPKKVEPKVKQVEKPKEPAVKEAGDYYVQLGSVRSREGADSEWKKIKAKYSSALSGYSYRVETASLPKGTFYRIQAGPVSKAQATTTCNAIKRQSPGACLVKKK